MTKVTYNLLARIKSGGSLRCGISARLMTARGLGSVKTIFEVVWRNINVGKRPETHVKFS